VSITDNGARLCLKDQPQHPQATGFRCLLRLTLRAQPRSLTWERRRLVGKSLQFNRVIES
jgi:hypothetical protein